ncbi:LytTR family DNA-binding domain-containing protein [Candidatus Sulfidibacterium hydrothermale]|uniref:LytR/AlgR family response regulator transcription factor n=1 Tax=Candidatus Sulfidibacterium hydrothermale TaxID=2875962 RepID=UPI001F0A14E1|nr:LytTR family DNA-binding domain-containing protein [Candidatus Sulfidibacterium hydrothermale]UBM62494.1 LytTR family DNA-binding domain-containing protein [Candidatus Sulfidibacterium hydrothermale]
MKIKTLIIEDEQNARKAIENMLTFYCPEVELAGYASSVKEGLELIRKSSPDLLLLDVHLPDGTGFDLMKKISKKRFKIVFVTAHDQYALKAIKLSALDYLLKPVKPDELRKAMNKVHQVMEREEQLNLQIDTVLHNINRNNPHKKLILNTSDKVFVLEIAQLVHCEAQDNYVKIFVREKDPILIAKTLKELEEMLTPYGFFRIHQSHLVNLNFVVAYEKKGTGLVRLKTGERLPVSSRKKEYFLKALQSFV